MEELRQCPFCGGVSTLHSIDCCKTVYAVCMNCGIHTVEYSEPEKAIEAWNRRVDNEID